MKHVAIYIRGPFVRCGDYIDGKLGICFGDDCYPSADYPATLDMVLSAWIPAVEEIVRTGEGNFPLHYYDPGPGFYIRRRQGDDELEITYFRKAVDRRGVELRATADPDSFAWSALYAAREVLSEARDRNWKNNQLEKLDKATKRLEITLEEYGRRT